MKWIENDESQGFFNWLILPKKLFELQYELADTLLFSKGKVNKPLNITSIQYSKPSALQSLNKGSG